MMHCIRCSPRPGTRPMYGLKNRHAMLKKILEQQGILNVDEYLTPPNKYHRHSLTRTTDAGQMAAKQLELQERQTVSQKPPQTMPSAQAKMALMLRRRPQAMRCSRQPGPSRGTIRP